MSMYKSIFVNDEYDGLAAGTQVQGINGKILIFGETAFSSLEQAVASGKAAAIVRVASGKYDYYMVDSNGAAVSVSQAEFENFVARGSESAIVGAAGNISSGSSAASISANASPVAVAVESDAAASVSFTSGSQLLASSSDNQNMVIDNSNLIIDDNDTASGDGGSGTVDDDGGTTTNGGLVDDKGGNTTDNKSGNTIETITDTPGNSSVTPAAGETPAFDPNRPEDWTYAQNITTGGTLSAATAVTVGAKDTVINVGKDKYVTITAGSATGSVLWIQTGKLAIGGGTYNQASTSGGTADQFLGNYSTGMSYVILGTAGNMSTAWDVTANGATGNKQKKEACKLYVSGATKVVIHNANIKNIYGAYTTNPIGFESSITYNYGQSSEIYGAGGSLTGNTNITINDCYSITAIYGSSKGQTGGDRTLTGNTNITVNGSGTNSTAAYNIATIFGGGVAQGGNDTITGDTHVTVNGGKIGVVVGGAFRNGYGSGTAAIVTGTVEGAAFVNVTDGTIGIVQGGGLTNYHYYLLGTKYEGHTVVGTQGAERVAANGEYATNVIVSGGTIKNGINGGGAVAISSSVKTQANTSIVYGDTLIDISGGTVGGNIGGGGAVGTYTISSSEGGGVTPTDLKFNTDSSYGARSYVYGDTYVKISGNAQINATVFGGGGGAGSIVTGSSNVIVSGGTVAGDIWAGGTTKSELQGNANVSIYGGVVNGNIYGDGKDSATVAGTSTLNFGNASAAKYTASFGQKISGFDVVNVSNAAISLDSTAALTAGVLNISVGGNLIATLGASVTISGGLSIAAGGEFTAILGANITISSGLSIADGGKFTVDASGVAEGDYLAITGYNGINYDAVTVIDGGKKIIGNDLYIVAGHVVEPEYNAGGTTVTFNEDTNSMVIDPVSAIGGVTITAAAGAGTAVNTIYGNVGGDSTTDVAIENQSEGSVIVEGSIISNGTVELTTTNSNAGAHSQIQIRGGVSAGGNVTINNASENIINGGGTVGTDEEAVEIMAGGDVVIDNHGHFNAHIVAGGNITATNTSVNTLIGSYEAVNGTINVNNTGRVDNFSATGANVILANSYDANEGAGSGVWSGGTITSSNFIWISNSGESAANMGIVEGVTFIGESMSVNPSGSNKDYNAFRGITLELDNDLDLYDTTFEVEDGSTIGGWVFLTNSDLTLNGIVNLGGTVRGDEDSTLILNPGAALDFSTEINGVGTVEIASGSVDLSSDFITIDRILVDSGAAFDWNRTNVDVQTFVANDFSGRVELAGTGDINFGQTGEYSMNEFIANTFEGTAKVADGAILTLDNEIEYFEMGTVDVATGGVLNLKLADATAAITTGMGISGAGTVNVWQDTTLNGDYTEFSGSADITEGKILTLATDFGDGATINMDKDSDSASSRLVLAGDGTLEVDAKIIGDNGNGTAANADVIEVQENATLVSDGALNGFKGNVEINTDKELTLAGKNETFAMFTSDGTLNLGDDATLKSDGALNAFTGTALVNDQTLNLDGVNTTSAVFTSDADGVVNVNADTTLTADNSGFEGTVNIDKGSTLNVMELGAATIDMLGSSGETLNLNAAIEYASVIKGDSKDTININGSEVTLSGDNSGFEGTVKIASGNTLNVENELGAAQINMIGTAGETLNFNVDGTYASGIVGDAKDTINVNNASEVTLTGNNTSFAGDVNVKDGSTLNVDGLLGAVTIDLEGTGTETLNFDFSGTYVAKISGAAEDVVNVNDGSTVTLSGNNSGFKGTLNVNDAGTLTLSGDNSGLTGTINVNDGSKLNVSNELGAAVIDMSGGPGETVTFSAANKTYVADIIGDAADTVSVTGGATFTGDISGFEGWFTTSSGKITILTGELGEQLNATGAGIYNLSGATLDSNGLTVRTNTTGTTGVVLGDRSATLAGTTDAYGTYGVVTFGADGADTTLKLTNATATTITGTKGGTDNKTVLDLTEYSGTGNNAFAATVSGVDQVELVSTNNITVSGNVIVGDFFFTISNTVDSTADLTVTGNFDYFANTSITVDARAGLDQLSEGGYALISAGGNAKTSNKLDAIASINLCVGVDDDGNAVYNEIRISDGWVKIGDKLYSVVLSKGTTDTLLIKSINAPVTSRIFVNPDWDKAPYEEYGDVDPYDGEKRVVGLNAAPSLDKAVSYISRDVDPDKASVIEIRKNGNYSASVALMDNTNNVTDMELRATAGYINDARLTGEIFARAAILTDATTLTISNLGANNNIYGGANNAASQGNTELIIKNGDSLSNRITGYVIGGDKITSGIYDRNGDSAVSLDGGSYTGAYVVGGSYALSGGQISGGNSQISISNNSGADMTINSRILGGGLASGTGSKVTLDSASVVIDASNGKINLRSDIYAGGAVLSGGSVIVGSTSVSFSGKGENLTFTGRVSGGVLGGGSVTGSKSFIFDGFTGAFNGLMQDFNTVVFSGDSSVTFGRKQTYTSDTNVTFELSNTSIGNADAMYVVTNDNWNFSETITVAAGNYKTGLYTLVSGYDVSGFTFSIGDNTPITIGSTVMLNGNTYTLNYDSINKVLTLDYIKGGITPVPEENKIIVSGEQSASAIAGALGGIVDAQGYAIMVFNGSAEITGGTLDLGTMNVTIEVTQTGSVDLSNSEITGSGTVTIINHGHLDVSRITAANVVIQENTSLDTLIGEFIATDSIDAKNSGRYSNVTFNAPTVILSVSGNSTATGLEVLGATTYEINMDLNGRTESAAMLSFTNDSVALQNVNISLELTADAGSGEYVLAGNANWSGAAFTINGQNISVNGSILSDGGNGFYSLTGSDGMLILNAVYGAEPTSNEVAVNSDWTYAVGTYFLEGGKLYKMGTNAFSTLSAAVTGVNANGTVDVIKSTDTTVSIGKNQTWTGNVSGVTAITLTGTAVWTNNAEIATGNGLTITYLNNAVLDGSFTGDGVVTIKTATAKTLALNAAYGKYNISQSSGTAPTVTANAAVGIVGGAITTLYANGNAVEVAAGTITTLYAGGNATSVATGNLSLTGTATVSNIYLGSSGVGTVTGDSTLTLLNGAVYTGTLYKGSVSGTASLVFGNGSEDSFTFGGTFSGGIDKVVVSENTTVKASKASLNYTAAITTAWEVNGTIDNNNFAFTLGAPISGSGQIIKTGAGNVAMTVSGDISAFSGSFINNSTANTFTVSGARSGNGTTTMINNSGAFSYTGANNGGGTINLTNNSTAAFAYSGANNNNAAINLTNKSTGGFSYTGINNAGGTINLTNESTGAFTWGGTNNGAATVNIINDKVATFTISNVNTGGSAITVNNNSTGTITWSGANSGSGIVNIYNGAGTVNISGALNGSSKIILNSGLATISGAMSSFTGSLNAAAGATITYSTAAASMLSPVLNFNTVAGMTGTIKSTIAHVNANHTIGGGLLQMTGAGTYAGTFTGAGDLTVGAAINFSGNNSGITGTVSVTGTNTLGINSANSTFAGAAEIALGGGTLNMAADVTLTTKITGTNIIKTGAATNTVTLSGDLSGFTGSFTTGTFILGADATVNELIKFTSGNLTVRKADLDGTITSTGASTVITMEANGTATVNTAGNIFLNGNSGYTIGTSSNTAVVTSGDTMPKGIFLGGNEGQTLSNLQWTIGAAGTTIGNVFGTGIRDTVNGTDGNKAVDITLDRAFSSFAATGMGSTVNGDIDVTIGAVTGTGTASAVFGIFGRSNSSDTTSYSSLNGDMTMTLNGTTVVTVYAGYNAAESTGDITLNLNNTNITGSLNGWANNAGGNGALNGNLTMNAVGGTIKAITLAGISSAGADKQRTINGDVTLVLDGVVGAINSTTGAVTGTSVTGGSTTNVTGTLSIELKGGTVATTITGGTNYSHVNKTLITVSGDTTSVNTSIRGGSLGGNATYPGSVGTAEVVVNGGSVGTIYGGGFANIANVTVNGGKVTTLYGSGKVGGGETTNTANIMLSGGTVTNVYAGAGYSSGTTVDVNSIVNNATVTLNGGTVSTLIDGVGVTNGSTLNLLTGTDAQIKNFAMINVQNDVTVNSAITNSSLTVADGNTLTIDKATAVTWTTVNADVSEGGKISANNLTLGSGTTITVDAGSVFEAGTLTVNAGASVVADFTTAITINSALSVKDGGSFTINAAGAEDLYYKIISGSVAGIDYSRITLAESDYNFFTHDNDLYITSVDVSQVYVDQTWKNKTFGEDLGDGKVYGINAFNTISEAINSAGNGATINVVAGTYTEAVAIDRSKTGPKELSIIGATDANGKNLVTLRGGWTVGDTTTGAWDAGLSLKNLDFTPSSDVSPLQIKKGGNIAVENCNFTAFTGSDYVLDISLGSAVFNVEFNGCTFKATGTSLMNLYSGAKDNGVTFNDCSMSQIKINIQGGSSFAFIDCDISYKFSSIIDGMLGGDVYMIRTNGAAVDVSGTTFTLNNSSNVSPASGKYWAVIWTRQPGVGPVNLDDCKIIITGANKNINAVYSISPDGSNSGSVVTLTDIDLGSGNFFNVMSVSAGTMFKVAGYKDATGTHTETTYFTETAAEFATINESDVQVYLRKSIGAVEVPVSMTIIGKSAGATATTYTASSLIMTTMSGSEGISVELLSGAVVNASGIAIQGNGASEITLGAVGGANADLYVGGKIYAEGSTLIINSGYIRNDIYGDIGGTYSGTIVINGGVISGSVLGFDVVESNAAVTIGGGLSANMLNIADRVTLTVTGKVTVGSDSLYINGSVNTGGITGDDGNGALLLSGVSSVKGNVDLGAGDDLIDMEVGAILDGSVSNVETFKVSSFADFAGTSGKGLAGSTGAVGLVSGDTGLESFKLDDVDAILGGAAVQVFGKDTVETGDDVWAKLATGNDGSLVVSWGNSAESAGAALDAFKAETLTLGQAVVDTTGAGSFETMSSEEFRSKKSGGALA